MTWTTRRRTAVAAGVGLAALVAWWWRPPAPPTPLARSSADPLVVSTIPAAMAQPPEPRDEAPEPPPLAPEAEPLPPREGEVRCLVHMDDPVEGTLEMTVELKAGPGRGRQAAFPVEIREGELVFEDTLPDSLHHGQLSVPGYLRTAFSWTPRPDGSYDCAPIRLQQAAFIVGTVRPPPKPGPGGAISVRGCGGSAWVAPDGTFYLEGAPTPCLLHAHRLDGWYPVTSAPVRVEPRLGEEVEVELVLPELEQAGMGIHAEPTDEGMRVDAVRTGSAADEVGLRPGDIVLSVDGQEVVGLDISEFSALTRGDVGTDLVIEVLVDGVREKRLLTRRFVPPESQDGEDSPDPDAWVR